MTGIPGDDSNLPDDDLYEDDLGQDDANFEGQADDQGNDDGELDPALAGGAPEEDDQRRPNRAQARVQEALRGKEEAQRERDELRRQLQEALNAQSRQRTDQEEQQRLAAMEPWDRAEYLAARAERRMVESVQSIEHKLADSTDKATFAGLCASNPALAKIQNQVEDMLAQSRANGVTLPRETVAKYLLGEQLLSRAPAARARAEKRATANVSRERARPVSGGSDTPASRTSRDDTKARRERLENHTI